MKIKAIDTYYKGYKFRSRLEARWAVFFDALNIEWEYEPEGYKFEDGTCYLPDFWLPQVKMWAEVKPIEFNDEEIIKVKNLVKHTNYPVIELIGVPELTTYNCWEMYKGEPWFNNEVVLSNYHNYPQDEGRFYSMPGEAIEDYPEYFPDTLIAVNAAKSKRFEFNGE